ncbi:rhomboid protein 2 [Calycina marina]|uniref:Rhomboid protein 2 n=1 Tax=Calycina marina TaxID=1763456 RepID=A0A9P8CEN4_9HELO|nr:rhomboid protein 2 [Calycina marina]
MAPSLPQFSAARMRSYIFRLPLFTRAVILIIVLIWFISSVQSMWDLKQWGALIPSEMSLKTLYRANTFPVIHAGFFHCFFNLFALTPLLERFEAEHGTLTSLALFVGPLSTFPAFLYTFIERGILHMNTTILGASIWVFTLLAMEAVKTYKTNPFFQLGDYKIPTWITPFVMVLFVSFLVPNTSFLGHVCGLAFGYGWGLGFLKFLVPPENTLRWIEGKMNLLGRLPHYVSVDQKTFGRFGVLPSTTPNTDTPLGYVGASGVLLQRHPRLLKLPPYLSFLCVIIGIGWLLVLPLDDYSRNTYISENALLPGQVHTYFAGSDQHTFRGYMHEVGALQEKSNTEVNDKLEEILRSSGLKVARQKYEYRSAGGVHAGENIYAILHAPRGDATEAIVLVGAWVNMDGKINRSGVALVLTLARYFKRWSLWSKDIVFLIAADSKAAPQAWVDAYHDAHQSPGIESLQLKSGALQGAVVIDYPFDHRFESLHIVYDGINGQLPNLDLLNTVVSIASGQMGIGVSLQQMWHHSDSYKDRLQTMLRGMMNQGLGHASGPHSSFIPYHIDALTLQPFGNGWQDEMAMGRVIESTFRSLNNLLEHLHQSFFFYLLMQANRFVSIGTYLPSAMLVAVNFTIMAIFLWMKSGAPRPTSRSNSAPATDKTDLTIVHKGDLRALVSTELLAVRERDLFLPLGTVAAIQFLGVIPLYIFNHASSSILTPIFYTFALANNLLPILLSALLIHFSAPTTQQYHLLKSFSLLLLGLFLSSLATLNFSLSLLVGLLATPLTYIHPIPSSSILSIIAKILLGLLLMAVGPTGVLMAGSWAWGWSVGEVLEQAAFGWDVWGMYTQVVVWCVWWPAWVMGGVLLFGRPRREAGTREIEG